MRVVEWYNGGREFQIWPPLVKGKKVVAEIIGSEVVLKGKTFEIKDDLKKMGFRWDNIQSGWSIPTLNWTKTKPYVKTLVESTGFEFDDQT